MSLCVFIFFFFQAEDGIRDYKVTGVQTCALPILTGLARFVIELEGNAWHTAAVQWLERTLDDSANRRLVLPEAFLATDAILVLATNVAAGIEGREPLIPRPLAPPPPFLATQPLAFRG